MSDLHYTVVPSLLSEDAQERERVSNSNGFMQRSFLGLLHRRRDKIQRAVDRGSNCESLLDIHDRLSC